jgi:exodeoxyribonuclease VII small subunit
LTCTETGACADRAARLGPLWDRAVADIRKSGNRELQENANVQDVNQDVASLPFEAALKELEDIVDQLEKGSVALEHSIAIYTRGEALKKHCEGLLRSAEQRIEKITLGPDGRPNGAEPLDAG